MTARFACSLLTALALGCAGTGRSDSTAGRPAPSSSPAREPAPPPPGMETLMDGTDSFGGRLLAGLLADTPEANVAVSPVSVSLAMAMAGGGARGETRAALLAALGFAGMEPGELGRRHAALLERLRADDADVTLDIANSLWVREGIPLSEEYIAACARDYGARTGELDFRSEQAVATINDWVRARTRGRIPGIVDQLREEDALVLLNAVYFKGRWSEPFELELTRDREFRRPDGSRPPVPMMQRAGRFDYGEADGLQVLRLPYGEGGFALYLLLPAEDDQAGVSGLADRLTGGEFEHRRRGLNNREGELVLPRFRLEFSAQLNRVLSGLGMAIAFDPARADFQGMLKAEIDMAFYINEVVHKSFIEVNEEGTEAAAATGTRMGITSVPLEADRFRMVCDRPFLWLIRDEATGTTLFIGAVNDPS